MRWPLDNFQVTQGFYLVAQPGHSVHTGIDLAAPEGSSIKSPIAGTVVGDGEDPNYIGGKYVIIREDGGRRREFYMGHMSLNEAVNGQHFNEGDEIGKVGRTGQATGPHVHFQVRNFGGGALLNPTDVINEGNGMADDESIRIFNEGDRINFNDYMFKEDRGEFKSQVGKLWKFAVYEIMESAAVKMELYFNDGDRNNVNGSFYGREMNRFGGGVGRTWKRAVYEYILGSQDFKTDQLVNQGDVGNLNAILGGNKVSDAVVGKTWKEFVYNDLQALIPREGNSAKILQQVKDLVNSK